jgi:hypothetical protein
VNDQIPEPGSSLFMQLPEEIRHVIEHQVMHAEQTAHDVRDFFEGLDEQQLRNLRGLFVVINNSPEATHYYMGLIGGYLALKYNVCIACSKNHDKDLEEMTGPGGLPADEIYQPDPEVTEVVLRERKTRMLHWDVTPVLDNDWFGKVICTGPCKGAEGNATWASLEAREEGKLGAGGCSFCMQKEAWG